MKKFIPLIVMALLSGLLLTSCKKCIVCTEAKSGTETEYCGTPSQVKSFEKTLKEEGKMLGQEWTCINK